jgi:pimeloyl-ACP methyl ester carboxylesterase
MDILSKLFKVTAARMPRVRGFGSSFYFGHPFLDAWFAWFPLNQIQYDGAAVGEIYNVASRIDERKSVSWIEQWSKEAERVSAHAEVLESSGHRFSAANAFLRSYTYYRTAHLATDPINYPEELEATYKELTRCYARFAELSDVRMEAIQVPLRSEGSGVAAKLHGWFFHAANVSEVGPKPTVVWLSGAESIAEDVYWWCAAEGIRRGFNVLAVDLPGDTATRIENPNVMIEGAGDRGLLSVVDYALARPDVDTDAFYVYGISMGGYRAGRLAQIDDRAAGIIANAPMLNASGVLAAVKDVHKAPKEAHGWAYRMFWQYGVDAHQPLKMALEELVDGVWGRCVVDPSSISVPFLTMAGENELGHEGIRQAKAFHMQNGSPAKQLRITKAVEGAGAHCQLDNFPLARQIVFDWIEDRMRERNQSDGAPP